MARWLWILGIVALFAAGSPAADLVRDGKPVAVLAIAPQPDEAESLAVRELTGHVEKISGAKLPPAVTVAAADLQPFLDQARKEGKVPVVLGRAALPRVEKLLDAKSPRAGTFAIVAMKDAVFAAGREFGTAFAVSELLEQQGVRWFMPGDLGTAIPSLKTITVKEQTTVQAPSFETRWFQMPDRDWQVRVRCGGPQFPGAHGLPGVPKFQAAPELYSLVNGKRVPRQHCLSNPQLLDVVVAAVKAQRAKGKGPTIGMGPNDGGGFCQCDNCKKLDGRDFDPFSSEPSVTDRYVWFFNRVLERLSDYPDTKLAFYIYHSYMRPPVREKPNPRIVGALAPIALDRVHGFSNPIAPEKSYASWLLQEWTKLLPEIYDRGYWSNLADPGFPFIIVHRLRDEIPVSHGFGLKGWRVETFPNYAAQLPSNYVAARLMWDHTADVDAILKDFAEKFFGPAAGPMETYVKRMDAALRDTPYITGSAWDMPHHYPAAFRKEMRGLLEDAGKRSAGQGIYETRVRVIADTFDMLEAFIAMLDLRARGDFVGAKSELDRLDVVANRLMAIKPVPMISAGRFSTYVNYMRRFFRPATEQAYLRVSNGNKRLAVARDEWQFVIDPPKVGEAIGLWRPEVTGGNWQTIRTSTSSWSNQGLRYYKGLAWHRQTLELPADFPRERVFFWCGGVDEKAKVWINGKQIGISPGAAFSPFEMDATDAVKPGKNVIVVAVLNEVVNELGTGGIVAPVMLYAPAAGRNAKLENIRPLGETFP